MLGRGHSLGFWSMKRSKLTFGEKVREERKGLPPVEFARQLGVKRQSIYQWERLTRCTVEPENLQKLVDYSGKPHDYWLETTSKQLQEVTVDEPVDRAAPSVLENTYGGRMMEDDIEIAVDILVDLSPEGFRAAISKARRRRRIKAGELRENPSRRA